MLETLIMAFAGSIAGIITGLVPGLHTNNIILALGFIQTENNTPIIAGIAAMSIANQFAGFIPSTLIGVPAENNFAGTLPAHSYAKKGKGLKAIRLSVAGGIAGFFATIAALPFAWMFISATENYISGIIPIALSAILILMVAREKTTGKKISAALTIILAGVAGLFLLESALAPNSLFALVTGFFGMPTLLMSAAGKKPLCRQAKEKGRTNTIEAAKLGVLATIASIIGTVFPALGPNEMIYITGKFSGNTTRKKFLMLNGGVMVSTFAMSFAGLLFLGKARNASAAYIAQASVFSQTEFLAAMFGCFLGVAIGGFATLALAEKAAAKLEKANYPAISKGIAAMLFAATFISSGIFGTIMLLCATSLGLFAEHSQIKRTCCMAFLLVPTIFIYMQQ